MLDLFCGRFGWSKAFAARGWECVGVDLVRPPEVPCSCEFVTANILSIVWDREIRRFRNTDTGYIFPQFDFICASSPCENFSIFGLKCFFPEPKYPELGIRLFNHTRSISEESGIPYIMENVRSAQEFVGNAVHHCGSFYLWGNSVPPLIPKGITKGWERTWIDSKGRTRTQGPSGLAGGQWKEATNGTLTAIVATIPPELSSCIADYAERILDAKRPLG